MWVRALRECFIDGTLRREKQEFEYSGPKNENVEAVKAAKPVPAETEPAK